MLETHVRVVGLAVLAIVLVVGAVTAALPRQYAATARVLVPERMEVDTFASVAAARDISVSRHGGSRMLLVQHVGTDPRRAAQLVNDFVSTNARRNMVIVDPASVPYRPVGPSLTLNLALGAGAGLLLGLGLVAFRERRPQQPPRDEAERTTAPADMPSAPLSLAERDYEPLCRQLAASWFCGHRMLAVVGLAQREAQAKVAARLAAGFAGLGEKTLLVDAGNDSRDGVRVKPVAGVDNLFLLFAPRERLAAIATEAGRRFRVVLIDVHGEHDEGHSFAALAGGALIVAPADQASSAALSTLQAALSRAPARIVATLLSPG